MIRKSLHLDISTIGYSVYFKHNAFLRAPSTRIFDLDTAVHAVLIRAPGVAQRHHVDPHMLHARHRHTGVGIASALVSGSASLPSRSTTIGGPES
jgi:hypothetical protein